MRMNRGLVLSASCVLAVIAVASSSPSGPGAGNVAAAAANAPAPWTVRVEAVQPPAAADSSQPQITASHRGVVLILIELPGRSTITLKFADRTASGWAA